jgi:hypothetical protein
MQRSARGGCDREAQPARFHLRVDEEPGEGDELRRQGPTLVKAGAVIAGIQHLDARLNARPR